MYKLIYNEKYLKKLAKFLKKHPDLKLKYYKIIELLEQDPFYPSLRLHKLKGDKSNIYSVSIDMQYRIIIDLVIVDNIIYLLDIGSYDEVY